LNSPKQYSGKIERWQFGKRSKTLVQGFIYSCRYSDGVAEVRIEQVVGTHDSKPGIDRATFDFVDSRFHVVVDAATRHSA
jgi:hypothetical protein